MQDAIAAFSIFRTSFTTFLAERLKVLLETRHLYQKLSINPLDILATLRADISPVGEQPQNFERLVEGFLDLQFPISDKVILGADDKQIVCFIVGNVKLFCSGSCGGREAFRPILFSDITQSLRANKQHQLKALFPENSDKYKIAFGDTFQLFYVVYQCQRCEGKPEVFLVKRDRMNLSIEGRSPIEHIEVPNYIPKEEQNWFRDAVIAFQTGKVLAALFYLRTFIEQFGRRKTNLKDERKTGDEIMTAYADTLPSNLRGMMPSLGEWYDKLSEALHGAKEDSELFNAAKEKIEKHFDIRRVYELDSKPVTTPDTKNRDNKQAKIPLPSAKK